VLRGVFATSLARSLRHLKSQRAKRCRAQHLSAIIAALRLRSNDMPTSRFAALISAAAGVAPLLPLTHTTDGYWFRDIISAKNLALNYCDVFKEDLLYLFYGRPAYRTSVTTRATLLDAFSFVCFVLRTETLPMPRRIFPFDSGAMSHGLYNAHLHPKMKLHDFEMATDLKEAQKLVDIFYGDNESYFLGRCIKGQKFPILDMEAQCYLSLIESKAQSDADDRKGSIEIQFDQCIALDPTDVLAVVLPEPFWDDKDVSDFVTEDLKAQPLSYDCYHAQPAEDTRAIMSEVRQFLKNRSLL
jgi:hypothetical protein